MLSVPLKSSSSPLSQTGDEGALRSQYLNKLKASEDKLEEIEKHAQEMKKALKQSKVEVRNRIKKLEQEMK